MSASMWMSVELNRWTNHFRAFLLSRRRIICALAHTQRATPTMLRVRDEIQVSGLKTQSFVCLEYCSDSLVKSKFFMEESKVTIFTF